MKSKHIKTISLSTVMVGVLLSNNPINLTANAEEKDLTEEQTEENKKEPLNTPTISDYGDKLVITTSIENAKIYFKINDSLNWEEYLSPILKTNIHYIEAKIINEEDDESAIVTKQLEEKETIVESKTIHFKSNLNLVQGSVKDAVKVSVSSESDLDYYFARGSFSTKDFSKLELEGKLNNFENNIAYIYYGGDYTIFGIFGNNITSEVVKITDLAVSDKNESPIVDKVYNTSLSDDNFNITIKFNKKTKDWFYTKVDGGSWIKYNDGDLINIKPNSTLYTKFIDSEGNLQEKSLFLDDIYLEKQAEDVVDSEVENDLSDKKEQINSSIEDDVVIDTDKKEKTSTSEKKPTKLAVVKSTDVIYSNTLPKTGFSNENNLNIIGGIALTISFMLGMAIYNKRKKLD